MFNVLICRDFLHFLPPKGKTNVQDIVLYNLKIFGIEFAYGIVRCSSVNRVATFILGVGGELEMKKNTLFNWAAAALLTGLAIISGSAMAQTPDGETPANEGVCNVLQAPGISPGLYGLCVAYCEAQDLDSIDKEPPSTKILGNYNKRKQASDPAMPCVKVPCPCWTGGEMASISGDGIAAACNSTATSSQIIDIAPRTHSALSETAVGRERCRYVDLNTAPATIRSFTITPAEAASCLIDVKTACQITGF